MRLRRAAALAVGCAGWMLAIAGHAGAHDLGLARVELRELGDARYELRASVTQPFDPDRLAPQLPDRCESQSLGVTARGPLRVELLARIDCSGPALGPGDAIALPWGRSGALVIAHWADGREARRFFQNGAGGVVTIPLSALGPAAPARLDTARSYALLGVEHILLGWDHLAFVLALGLLASGWKLVRLVTAFTLGHSASLSLAALGWVKIPVPPVEACIALSVAFLAREAVLLQRGRRPGHHGAFVIGAFGLLHGLGFASALSQAGVLRPELWLGLASFNAGVEIGQLLFLGLVAGVVAGLRRAPQRAGVRAGIRLAKVQTATAYALGVVGLFWTLERVTGFAG